jgi:hypothetical protein
MKQKGKDISENMLDLRVMYQNAGGYKQFLKEHDADQLMDNYDLVLVGEPWVDQGNKEKFCIHGFEAHHCFYGRMLGQKGRHHGGISAFANKKTLHGLSQVHVSDSTCRCIVWLEFATINTMVAAVYIAPENSKVWHRLDAPDVMLTLREGVTKAISKGQQVMLVGDMNARMGALSDVPSLDILGQHEAEPAIAPGQDVSAQAGFYESIPIRACKDAGINDRGKELCQLLKDTGLVLLNGRVGGDAGVGANTFKSSVLTSTGDHGASMVDLVCVSHGLYACVKGFSVSKAAEGKHAELSINLSVTKQGQANVVSDSSAPGVEARRIRVCRPNVGVLLKHAAPHLLQYESHFAMLLEDLQERKGTSATQALGEIVEVIKVCIGLGMKDERRQAAQEGRPSQTKGATWYDGECTVVKMRFKTAWKAYRRAMVEQPPLPASQLEDIRAYAIKCRYEYQSCCSRKREQDKQEKEKEAIRKYFANAKDFWQVFTKGTRSACALDSIDEVTAYYASLLGRQGEEMDARKGTWEPPVKEEQLLIEEDCECMNAPLTREELIDHIRSCKNGKAADLNGMTAEALKLVVAAGCNSLLDCLVAILDGCNREVPEQIMRSKLTPIPKGSTKSKDPSQYRGIAVGDFFGKLGDKFRNARLTAMVEKKKLRCFAQCGFRPQHGTLDAVFALQHLIDKTRSSSLEDACLISCLIDFEKAFDRVDRDLMLRRCKQLGISGKFFDALVKLYEKMQVVVVLNGAQGQPIDTCMGTKQGSELSPILFGLFIEQLDALLRQNVPGAGPMIGNIRVPVLLYADDANVLSRVAELKGLTVEVTEMQQMLDCLELFCALFGMKVNVAKTKFVIFRKGGRPLPDSIRETVWYYKGQPIKVVDEEKYLGFMLHGNKGPCHTAGHRAQCGSKASHGMLHKCIEVGIYRPDIVCSLFDKLVRPVLSYGAQIWGPYMFEKWWKEPLARENEPERVHTDFLRQISGMPKHVHKASLYREFGRKPLMVQWLVLAARWWNNLASKEEDSIGYKAFRDNVGMMTVQRGDSPIWSTLFLKAMYRIGVLKHEVWRQEWFTSPVDIFNLSFDEVEVQEAATKLLMTNKWQMARGVDPKSASHTEVFWATYEQWVTGTDPGKSARHIEHYMPLPLRRCMLKLRLGCHKLAIQSLRMQGVPRHERTCAVCHSGEVEDLMHFVMDCGHYAHIRARHNNIFGACMAKGRSRAATLRLIFDHPHQLDLALCLQDMSKERESILSKAIKDENVARDEDVARQDSLEEGEIVDKGWEISTYPAGFLESPGSVASTQSGSCCCSSACSSSYDGKDEDEEELVEVMDTELSALGFVEISI